ncbi:MAG: right-handed parallel beta-helix repeat-containing protein [Pseudomonadota bacterium]
MGSPIGTQEGNLAFISSFISAVSVFLFVGSAAAQSCGDANVLCVPQEYSTIQAAADASVAGQTVLVSDGSYTGFQITRSGNAGSPITFKAAGSGAVISSPIPGSSSAHCVGDGICFKGNGSLQGVHDIVLDGFKIQNVYRCVSSYDASPETNSPTEWPHQRLTLRNNECSGSAHEGFYMSEFNGSLIEANVIHDTGTNGLDRGHCMYLANAGSDDTTIRGNLVYNCGVAGAAAMHFNGDDSVGGDGYQTGLLIERNVIHDTLQNGLNMDGVGDSTIQNNLVYNVARYAIDAYAIDASAGPRNLKVVNNTFIGSSSAKPALIFTEDQGGHVLFNNIRVQDGTDTGDPTGAYDLIATHAQATPWFVSIAGGDYHLKSGVAPIDSGWSSQFGLAAPSVDLEQGSRPEGTGYDMGAYEYGSVAVSPPPTPSLTPPPGATPTPVPSSNADPSTKITGGSASTDTVLSAGCGAISESGKPADVTWLLLSIAGLLIAVRKKRQIL